MSDTQKEVPKRIQRKREKGWKMPEGAVYVGRPTIWGNNFSVKEYGRDLALLNFRMRVDGLRKIRALDTVMNVRFLRGKDLACWCPLDQPCHADILLEIANG
jgi:hypothetical protein